MATKGFFKLLFLLLLITACQPTGVSQPETPSTEADEAAIRALLQRSEDLWNAADLEGTLADYADDIVQMPPEEPAIHGKEALRASWTEFFEENTSVWDFSAEDIQVSGDLAFVRGGFTATDTEKEDGEVEQVEGSAVFVLRRGSDSTWKFVIEIWNSDAADDDEEDDVDDGEDA